ncbi:hypothetical protein CA257_11665, partial [Sphingomonas koreensis]
MTCRPPVNVAEAQGTVLLEAKGMTETGEEGERARARKRRGNGGRGGERRGTEEGEGRGER